MAIHGYTWLYITKLVWAMPCHAVVTTHHSAPGAIGPGQRTRSTRSTRSSGRSWPIWQRFLHLVAAFSRAAWHLYTFVTFTQLIWYKSDIRNQLRHIETCSGILPKVLVSRKPYRIFWRIWVPLCSGSFCLFHVTSISMFSRINSWPFCWHSAQVPQCWICQYSYYSPTQVHII